MATKLKNLKITKVDFVDNGANPEAHIKLFKRKNEKQGVIKSIISFLSKNIGVDESEIKKALSDDENNDFDETKNTEKDEDVQEKINQEIDTLTNALAESIKEILLQNDNKDEGFNQDLNDFVDLIKNCFESWKNNKIAYVKATEDEKREKDVDMDKSVVATKDDEVDTSENKKEEKKEVVKMDFNKEKMEQGDVALLEALEKKYSENDKNDVAKRDEALIKELEELRKFKVETETNALKEVAKKYTALGKTEDELVGLFKSVKSVDEKAYTDLLATYDAMINKVDNSGLFTEIGKSSHGSNDDGAWARAEAKAVEIMKAKSVSKAEALDEVFKADVKLAMECEKETNYELSIAKMKFFLKLF